ncbi:(Fe-S)-binding protein [Desulfospira joergensenii]|uniref:(Fe-S)-binding protein n=1 Tax=Desulfospira joergensenii TaxID=53329 RepID=UPI0003B66790|nr:(Fe-S)-binding protein [Desulfospira joergensenii]
MFTPQDIIEILARNVRQTQSPFGIPRFMVNAWHKDQDLPKKGEYLLYTGLMYQFTPFIETSTQYLEKYEDTPTAEYLKYARYVPGYVSGIGLALMTGGKEKKEAGQPLKNIVRLLKESCIDFGYRPDLDHYSGILLYDMGDQDAFVAHARKVAQNLENAGIRKIITIDPHTTYALKELFPKYTGAQFEVTPYFELLDLKAVDADLEVTLHDPCFFGRYLGVSDIPRKVLAGLGIRETRIRNTKEFTSCCGGPAESISPALSNQIMETRARELQEPGKPIVAYCPICLGNLKKSGADVRDLSSLLVEHI